MNYTKSHHESGNAMIYIIIAIALFGALTLTLSRQGEQADGEDIADEQIAFYVTELSNYPAAMKNAVDQMIMSGSSVTDLDFATPNQASYDTAPYIHKVFHPEGGSVTYKPNFSSRIERDGAAGWYVQDGIHVEWTPTASNDVLLSAVHIDEDVCAAINKQITGSTTIPPVTGELNAHFINDATQTDLDATTCPTCGEYPSLCVSNIGADEFAYFNIITAR